MDRTTSQKIADVLKVLLVLAMICGVVLIFLVPVAVLSNGADPSVGLQAYLDRIFHPGGDDIAAAGIAASVLAWGWFWFMSDLHGIVLALFMLLLGGGSLVICRQALRVLDTVSRGEPFSAENAASLRRAALACFVIAAGALGRTGFTLCREGGLAALTSYTALFVPLFLMAGLLCLIVSGLFHQAAEMKAENDLTV